MTDEEEKQFNEELRRERNREDREPVKHPPICYQCGEVIEGEYYHYDYYDSKGKPHDEDYCEECTENFLKDFRTQGERNTADA